MTIEQKPAQALKKIEFAFIAWAILYVIYAILQLRSAPSEAAQILSAFGTAFGSVDNEIDRIILEAEIAELVLIVGCGWILVRLLGSGRKWIRSTFLWSCYFSIALNIYSIIFPDEKLPFYAEQFFQLSFLALTVFMLRETNRYL